MKRTIFLSIIAIIAIVACSKKNNPTPPDNPSPSNNGGTESFGVSDFDPKSGPIGTVVTIKGLAFGTDSNQVSIKFTNANAVKPKTITNSEMTVIVPPNTQTGAIQVTVKNGTPATTYSNFNVTTTTQTISGFSPKTVTQGDTLKITGTLFGNSISAVSVYFNRSISDLGTKPFSVTPTEIDVVVPSNAITGKFDLFVQGLGMITSTEILTFIPMTYVAAVYPASARAGEIVSINGVFPFSDDLNLIKVRFTGSTSDIIPLKNDGRNNILVRVPSDAKTGKIKVTKNGYTGGFTNNSFTVLPPLPQPMSAMWISRPDFPTDGRQGAFAFTVGNKAYVGGGTQTTAFGGTTVYSDVWEYDQTYDVWTQKADYGGGSRSNAAAFTIAGKGYVGTGLNSNNATTNDLWQYDPDSNTWTSKANFIGGNRAYAVGFVLNNKGYVGTGSSTSSSGSTNDFYQYDPISNSWTQITSINGTRVEAFSFTVNNQAYVGNGRNEQSNLLSNMYMYNPSSNTWTVKATLPLTGSYGSAGFAIGDKGYAGLGYTINTTTSGSVFGTNVHMFEYSPSTNTWKQIQDYGKYPVSSATTFVINNVAYVGMGINYINGQVFKDFWVYKP